MAKDTFIRKIALGFSVSFCAMVHGADVTIPSAYDEATGTWIGDVPALTNAIKNAVANQKIVLSKGVYDLSPLTNAPMYNASGSGYGAALIGGFPWVRNVKVVGETGNPEDVILTAVDSEYRIMILNSPGASLYNVTISGGNAGAAHINTYTYRRGGAVFAGGGGSIISNCVFHGNRAMSGGAVGAPQDSTDNFVYASVFYGNNDSEYGLAASNVNLHNCIFTNNVTLNPPKDNWSGSVVDNCKVYDSYFAHNVASRTGGISGGLAVNCRFFFNRQDNPNGANWGNPGGGAAYNSVLSNCIFYGNSAYRLGGAIRGGTVVNCTVVSNATRHASDALGGGIYNSSYVEGCNVSSNVSASGGGVSHCTAIDTDIMYNKAKSGGGARTSVLTGCAIAHNVATDYGNGNYGGAGGGMRYGYATNCVFRDNSCSATWESYVLKGCEIADTSMHADVIDSCVIRDVRNVEMARAIGNVAYPNGYATSNIFMIGGVKLMRNCLVTNCTWESIKGSYVNSAMFEPAGACTSRVENCSFIDNYIYLTARNYGSEAKTISFVNSVFHSTRNGDRKDISRLTCQYMVLSNCVYGTSEKNSIAEGYENFGCTSITDRAAYKFIGKGEHPYSLKRSSPLRGMGLVLGWMADGVDYADNPRLRDGKVDVGCYQCWLNPVGTVLSFR